MPGSWYGLADILAEARQYAATERRLGPIACPYCGEPLEDGPETSRVKHCRFDGYTTT